MISVSVLHALKFYTANKSSDYYTRISSTKVDLMNTEDFALSQSPVSQNIVFEMYSN